LKSAGRHPRHALINDIIHRALGKAGVATVKEPMRLLVGISRRPDGASLIPWARGKCLAWDATLPDSLTASHLPSTRITPGAAASRAATLQRQKYSTLTSSHIFMPTAVETLGAWEGESLNFIRELERRISMVTGDSRETKFLLQRLSVAIQRGNAIAFTGSMPEKLLPEEDDN